MSLLKGLVTRELLREKMVLKVKCGANGRIQR
jgi:hypothetical protein